MKSSRSMVILFVVLLVMMIQSGRSIIDVDGNDKSIDLIDPKCQCCGQPSGRYCGYQLNNDCHNNHDTMDIQCSSDSIYYCFSTYRIAQRVRNCTIDDNRNGGGGDGRKNCLQISIGSSRCSNQ
ncbi:hypothetical protein DERP_003499 [Dermatophagoides pteronyssinus]|uniref:Uncharacterized protein n=1 Tax=Dermatophagoides pteronyssinus TaxID=6956 RepID=A0ABQ8JLN1_DERPT|nr:hypothetical protein DERP_003499 [Dermatophagoides pteronyssinus]